MSFKSKRKSKKVYSRKNKKTSRRRNKYLRRNNKRITRKMGGAGKRKKVFIQVVSPLNNNKQQQIPLIDAEFYINGGDYLFSQEYKQFFDAYNQIPPEQQLEVASKINNFKDDITNRMGAVRCEAGIYTFLELPKYTDTEVLSTYLNHLLKFVIVKGMDGIYRILLAYASMLNFDYTEYHIKKWLDQNIDHTGNIIYSIRQTPKNVELITQEIIKNIERSYSNRLVNGNLLLTKSFRPDVYDEIINEYFSKIHPHINKNNTVFLLPSYEISHSCIANNFRDVQLQMSTDEGIERPLIYGGFEGVFYKNDENNRLYFVIANLSGHFKTPKERMNSLLKPLLEEYGYIGEIIDDPPPPTPPSSQDSDSSDAPREEYRRFITNDPDITTFENALARLNAANITPVKGQINPSYSQELEMNTGPPTTTKKLKI